MCSKVARLWASKTCRDWNSALEEYWPLVKLSHMALEKKMDTLELENVRAMNAEVWYDFLFDEYFRWKYTAPNRYATTSHHLQRQADEIGKEKLLSFRDDIFELAPGDIQRGLKAAMQIRGLGTAGASGLLSLLFPAIYGTVDQFVVKALLQVPDLEEHDELLSMNPEGLTVSQGVILIEIMERKAQQLNELFGTQEWTPRKIDKVLWAVR